MKLLIKISSLLGRYMAFFVVVIGAIALFYPQSCLWLSLNWIAPLLMLVMFGMGLTLKSSDFKLLLIRPKEVMIGCIAQFTVMPCLAYILGVLFQLDSALMAGVILVGACPGGTASNVMTYLSKGDIALSVGLTGINTLLAPVLTPFVIWLFLRTSITVDFMAMVISIMKIVLLPIIAGCLVNYWYKKQSQKMIDVLPGISVLVIAIIIAAVVSHNAQKILETGFLLIVVVVLHNLLGYVSGYMIGVLFKMTPDKTKALTIEIGMQNSGLASTLASLAFPGLVMATVPGAVFSIWHNISGAVLANIFRKWNSHKDR